MTCNLRWLQEFGVQRGHSVLSVHGSSCREIGSGNSKTERHQRAVSLPMASQDRTVVVTAAAGSSPVAKRDAANCPHRAFDLSRCSTVMLRSQVLPSAPSNSRSSPYGRGGGTMACPHRCRVDDGCPATLCALGFRAGPKQPFTASAWAFDELTSPCSVDQRLRVSNYRETKEWHERRKLRRDTTRIHGEKEALGTSAENVE